MSGRWLRSSLVLASVLAIGALCLPGCSKKRTRTVTVGMTCLSVSPASGPATGGTNVTISGSLFQTGATVLFGGAGATAVTVNPDGVRITCQTPTGAVGPVDVEVWNPDGSGCRIVDGFIYTGPAASTCGPCFTASPRCVSVLGGEQVTLLCDCGAGFDAGTTVSIDGWPVTAIFITSCELQITTPPLAPGPHAVEVCDAWGCRTFDGALVVPACGAGGLGVCSVFPDSGGRTGGDSVTITGCGFSGGVPDVYFGATRSTIVVMIDSTSILAVTPPSCPGMVDVTVVYASTNQAVLTRGYEYTAGPGDPVLASIGADSGSAIGGYLISLDGTDFPTMPEVYFGSNQASVQTVSSTQIVCVVPAAAGRGRVDVIVQDPTTGCRTLLGCAFEYQ